MSGDSTEQAPPGSAYAPLRVDETSPGVHVSVLSGPDEGVTGWTSGERFSIGSHASCDLSLRDPMVSRFHCELRGGERGFSVRDLESRNGTFLDDVPVLEGFVRDRSTLRLGESTLRLTLQEGVRHRLYSRRPEFGRLVGRSLAMRSVFAVLERVAPSDATVLLYGETGTGKEVAAVSIHEASARASGPFVPVDCAALVPQLAESELFGHVRGAFTGAERDREGAFRAADGGTLFLDELGELAPETQAKLLRALETGAVRPVGSTEDIPVDVRVVAATNRNLRREINRGTFREDLYYRLAVIEVRLPSLRERPEDVPLLAEAIFARMRVEEPLGPEVLGRLAKASWPGNVRQLRNALEVIAALGSDSANLALAGSVVERLDVAYEPARLAAQRAFERRYLSALLERAGGNVTKAARLAQLNRAYLHKLLRRNGLRGER